MAIVLGAGSKQDCKLDQVGLPGTLDALLLYLSLSGSLPCPEAPDRRGCGGPTLHPKVLPLTYTMIGRERQHQMMVQFLAP